VDEVRIFVLAGGKSARMGTDKAFVIFQNESLLARSLKLARAVTNSVSIVGDRAKYGSYAGVVEDVFPECGPLGGIHAALISSDKQLNLMLAVDLPFISSDLLHFLVAKARQQRTIVTIPQVAGGLQPLCAVYGREFMDVAEKALRAGKNKIDALFKLVNTTVIAEPELIAAGFCPDMFRNLNTPADVANATKTV
jgi:molybdopterin-guanine dinucleotide biosynthesis protein A